MVVMLSVCCDEDLEIRYTLSKYPPTHCTSYCLTYLMSSVWKDSLCMSFKRSDADERLNVINAFLVLVQQLIIYDWSMIYDLQAKSIESYLVYGPKLRMMMHR